MPPPAAASVRTLFIMFMMVIMVIMFIIFIAAPAASRVRTLTGPPLLAAHICAGTARSGVLRGGGQLGPLSLRPHVLVHRMRLAARSLPGTRSAAQRACGRAQRLLVHPVHPTLRNTAPTLAHQRLVRRKSHHGDSGYSQEPLSTHVAQAGHALTKCPVRPNANRRSFLRRIPTEALRLLVCSGFPYVFACFFALFSFASDLPRTHP
jgi:hypothetical protein